MISFDRLRHGKNSCYIAKRSSRPEVKVVFAGLKNTGISCKMALRANIVSKVGRQSPGIHDGRIDRSFEGRIQCALHHVDLPRSMTTLTPHSQKAKRRLLKSVATARNQSRQAGVTIHAKIDHTARETSECALAIAGR